MISGEITSFSFYVFIFFRGAGGGGGTDRDNWRVIHSNMACSACIAYDRKFIPSGLKKECIDENNVC